MNLAELHRDHVATLSRNISALLAQHGFDALVIHSGTPLKRTEADDQYWPHRITPYFHYFAPLNEPGCAVVLRAGARPVLVRPREHGFWEAPPEPEVDHFWAQFDVREVKTPADVKEHVPAGRTAFIGDDVRAATAFGITAQNPAPLVRALDALRVRKTPYELECLARANQRAALGHDELRELFVHGDRSELELHLSFLRATQQDDSEAPYKNIVALDEHAATLHHVSYSKRAQPSRSLLLDAGAQFAGYGSDITRTWVRGGGGAGAAAFAQLVAGLEALQQRICAMVRPGMKYEELHDESHRQAAVALREAGIGRGTAEELVASGVTRAFYPHGLGHSLGLQTHDVGCGLTPPRADNPFLRNTSVIDVGQTFTIEPGLYFIAQLLAPVRNGPSAALVDWSVVDALAPFGGIRIEDDVEVRANGIRNFTREALPAGGGVVESRSA